MNDTQFAKELDIPVKRLSRWRARRLRPKIDYLPKGKNFGDGVTWLDVGIRKARAKYCPGETYQADLQNKEIDTSEEGGIPMRVYGWPGNRKYVRVFEEGDTEKRGVMVIPPKMRSYYQGLRGGRYPLVYGARTENPEVYAYVTRPGGVG